MSKFNKNILKKRKFELKKKIKKTKAVYLNLIAFRNSF